MMGIKVKNIVDQLNSHFGPFWLSKAIIPEYSREAWAFFIKIHHKNKLKTKN